MSEASDRELVVRTMDLLNAARASRVDTVALPADDAIARGPTAVYSDDDAASAVGALRKALASEAAMVGVAKTIRGALGGLVSKLTGGIV